MTLENGYKIIHARFTKRVEEAKKVYMRTGAKRDKEYLDHLKSRLKNYTL